MNKKQNRHSALSYSSSSLSSASHKLRSAWTHISSRFSHKSTPSTTSPSSSSFTLTSSTFTANDRQTQSSSSRNTSLSTPPSSPARLSFKSRSSESSSHRTRKKKWIERNNAVADITVPPFSPTYCKHNEFPYSNFYVKLPDGKWMIRYRSGNRDILGTDVFAGYMI